MGVGAEVAADCHSAAIQTPGGGRAPPRDAAHLPAAAARDLCTAHRAGAKCRGARCYRGARRTWRPWPARRPVGRPFLEVLPSTVYCQHLEVRELSS
eukprot:scaffold1178_cov79-Phaeocystis_antarctica.AAC.2